MKKKAQIILRPLPPRFHVITSGRYRRIASRAAAGQIKFMNSAAALAKLTKGGPYYRDFYLPV